MGEIAFKETERKQEGIIDSKDHLHCLINELKKANRHLIYNFYMDEKNAAEYINAGRMYYVYVPRKYLNIWHIEREFIRLYYYIADIEAYDTIESSAVIVCDYIVQRKTDKMTALANKLEAVGLKQYAVFHKWTCDKIEYKIEPPNDISVISGACKGFFEMLRSRFNVYTDYVPEEEDAQRVFKSKICYSAVSDENQELVGGIVITKRGLIQTEEFLFVSPSYCNRGIAHKLHCSWYSRHSEENVKYVCWISDENEKSKKIHSDFGYVMNPTHKITMLKEGNQDHAGENIKHN